MAAGSVHQTSIVSSIDKLSAMGHPAVKLGPRTCYFVVSEELQTPHSGHYWDGCELVRYAQSKKKSHTPKAIKLKVLNQKVQRKDHQLEKLKNTQDVLTQATQLDNVCLELKTGRESWEGWERNSSQCHSRYSHIPNSSIGRNNSIGWKTTKI